MWIIACLLKDNLLHINELDLIRRYLPSYNRPRKGGRYSAFQSKTSKGTASDLVVQVVLIAESMRLQAMMATYGIQTQTPHEVEPVHIWPPKELVRVYQNLGVNSKLGLHGRPARPIGALGTSKIYRISGLTVLCYSLVFEVSEFYLSHDMALLIDNIKTELHFVGKYWRLSGRPTVCILIREEHMRDVNFKELLALLADLKTGYCDGLKVRTGRLQNLISSSCIEHLDFMNTMYTDFAVTPFKQLEHMSIGYQSLTDIPTAIIYAEESKSYMHMEKHSTHEIMETLRLVTSLQGQAQLLGILLRREGSGFVIGEKTVQDRVEYTLKEASSRRYWAVVRLCTALLSKEVDSISPFITTVLVSGKQLTIGYGDREFVLDKPVQPGEIHDLFYIPGLKTDEVIHAVLQQEVVLCCGKLIGAHPEYFRGILNIRVGWVVEAMEYYLSSVAKKDDKVESLAPNEVRRLVVKVLSLDEWAEKESLTPQQKRVINGCLGRTPSKFYSRVFHVLEKTPKGIRIGEKLWPQHPTLSEMHPDELNFALAVHTLLVPIRHPEYRQIVCDTFCIIATILERNPELRFRQELHIDVLIQEAFTIFLKDSGLEWCNDFSPFYNAAQCIMNNYLARAVVNCMLSGTMSSEIQEGHDTCNIS